MDIIKTDTGMKLIGIGEALVVAVRKEPGQVAHQVKVNHPDFGETTYIAYSPPAGLYRTPRIGDTCFVFCNENFHQYPVAWGHRISPELAAQIIGSRADNITVLYSSGAGANSVSHKVELDDGSAPGIRLSTAAGHSVKLNDNSAIEVTHKDGSSVTLSGDSIILSAGGSTLTISAAGVSISAAGGSKLDVGATILGQAADKRSVFDETGVATHAHTGNIGFPTTPPIKGT